MNKYHFIVTDNKVICLSSYMGRRVRGIAKCSPNDTFDVEFGKQLARARCDVKVMQKRHQRALALWDEADNRLYEAEEYMDKIDDYLYHAGDDYENAVNELNELLHAESISKEARDEIVERFNVVYDECL